MGKLDVVLPNGIQINNVKREEKSVLFELLDKLGVTSEQLLSLNTQQVASLQAGPNPQKKAEPPKRKSKLLSEVAALYLSETKLDNVAKIRQMIRHTSTQPKYFNVLHAIITPTHIRQMIRHASLPLHKPSPNDAPAAVRGENGRATAVGR